MRNRPSRSRAAAPIVALVVLGLVAAACGSSSKKNDASTPTTASSSSSFASLTGVPGVTDKEIHYAIEGTPTASNPLGDCYLECYADGVKAYFAYRNSQGGVFGRKLVLDAPVSDELMKAQQVALGVAGKNDAFGVFSVGLLSTAYAEFTKGGWPIYSFVTDFQASAGQQNIFGGFGVYTFDHPDVAHPFAVRALKGTKVAAIGYSIGSAKACVDQYKLEFDGIYHKLGISVVYDNATLPFGLPNGVGPEVTAMKKSGADLVFTCLDAGGLTAVSQEMKRQGMNAPLFTSSQLDAEYVTRNAAALEGVISMIHPRPLAAADSAPGSKAFVQWMKKTGATIHNLSYWGWASADTAFQGVKKAGEHFDRKKVIDATNSLTGYSADGMLGAFDIGRQHVGPTADDPASHGDVPHCYAFLQVKQGKLAMMSPATAAKPFLCWPGTTYEYSEPTPTNFK